MSNLSNSKEKKGIKFTYTMVNLTKALFRDKVLFEAKPSSFGLAFEGSPDKTGSGKLRYWRHEVELKFK